MKIQRTLLAAAGLALMLGGCEDFSDLDWSGLDFDTGLDGDVEADGDDVTDEDGNPSDVSTDTRPTDPNAGTQTDRDMCRIVNEYRTDNGLPAIPMTPAMMVVARTHAEDMERFANSNNDSSCNLHSWTDNGSEWSGCCYTADHAEASCMWDKPRELTAEWQQPFSGSGFEIAAWGYSDINAALVGWQGSQGHNNVIMNLGSWTNTTWRAMGCGADESTGNYAVWFSDVADPNGEITD